LTSFSLTAEVIHGDHLGRALGYPTANLGISNRTALLGKTGVYAAAVEVEGVRYGGMANIGFRPTLEKDGFTVEVHIFDFSGDLYGKRITVHFLEWIRNERKFPSLDELVRQMDQDRVRARQILSQGL
jgi:riboflavin kinase/FMN adenylyltransferase